MRRPFLAFLSPPLVAGLLPLIGCGGDAPAATTVVRTDSAGVALISNRGADRILDWRLDPVSRLGALEGPQAFSGVHDGSVGSDRAGNVYVLDTQAHRVLVFDRGGELVRALGRKGGGPGELQFPQYLAVSPDGEVTIVDYGKGLVSFAADGTPAGERRIASHPAGIAVGPFGVAGVLERYGEPGDSLTEQLVLLSGADSAVVAELRVPVVTDVSFRGCAVRISGMPPLLAPKIVWAAAGERLLVASGPEYVVDLLDHGGERVGSVRRDLTPTPTTPELARMEVGDSLRIRFGGGGCAVPPEDVVDARGYAPVVPLVRRIVGAPDGSFWVARGLGSSRAGRWTIDVFGPDGEYLGTLPEGTPFPAALRAADEALVVERDELDVPSVVVYRIERQAHG